MKYQKAKDLINSASPELSEMVRQYRAGTYRGRDFTEAEQTIFQEFVASRMDEVKATTEAEIIRSERTQHMTDYSLVIGIERAFIRSIPGHTLTDAFDRFQRSTFSTATGIIATAVAQVPQPDPVPSVNQHCQCSIQ